MVGQVGQVGQAGQVESQMVGQVGLGEVQGNLNLQTAASVADAALKVAEGTAAAVVVVHRCYCCLLLSSA
jgi:hypothetical protein